MKYSSTETQKMHDVVLSIGSNADQELRLGMAMQLLQQLLPGVRFTRALWTRPLGIDSDRFLNCLAYGSTPLSVDQLNAALKRIESKCGNTKSLRAEGVVCMDIDLLLFGHARYHVSDWNRNYISELLKEIPHQLPLSNTPVCQTTS